MTLRTACGSPVQDASTVEVVTYQGVMYAFCTPRCRALFEADPERYLPLRDCPTAWAVDEEEGDHDPAAGD